MITQAYLLLMAGLFPLFVPLSGYRELTQAKAMFFFVISGIYLLILSARRFADKRPAPPRVLWKCSTPVQKAVAVFLLLAIVSALFSPYGASTLSGAGRNDGLLTLLLYGALFFAVSSYGRASRGLLYASAAAMLISGMIAVLQLQGFNPLGMYPAGYNYFDGGIRYSGAFLGTLGNTNLLSAWYCLMLPLLLGTCWRFRRWLKSWQQVLLLLAAGLGIYVLLESGVKSGVFALMLTLFLALPQLLPISYARARMLAWLLLLLLLLICLLLLWQYSGQSGSLYEASQILHGNYDESFGSSRLQIWRQVISLIGERPWLGAGPGTISQRLDVVFSRIGESGAELTARVDNAHNVYLQLAADLGLPALLAYLLAGGALFSGWLRNRGQSPAIAILGSALLCYAIQDFFNLGLILTQPLLWLVAALLQAELGDRGIQVKRRFP